MDADQVAEHRYADGVRPPEPGELVGWRVLDPDGVIVEWGAPMQLHAVADLTGPGDADGGH